MKLTRYKTNLVAHCLLTEKVMTSIYDVAYKLNNLKNDNSVLLLVSFATKDDISVLITLLLVAVYFALLMLFIFKTGKKK